MDGVLLRRLRGALTFMAVWAIPWAVLGAAIGFWLIYGTTTIFIFGPPIPGGVPGTFALAGAITGALNGLLFSLLVAFGERRGGVDGIRPWRFALWGALSTFGVLMLTIGEPVIAAAFALFGAGLSAGMLILARRAPESDN